MGTVRNQDRLFVAHIEALLSCASPGDVLAICATPAVCQHSRACPKCHHVRVARGVQAVDVVRSLGLVQTA